MKRLGLIICATWLLATGVQAEDRWLPATAYVVPKHTAPEGEGYFSIIEGRNGRLYIGTHANAKNSWLVEFDPVSAAMAVVVDAQQAIGYEADGFHAQAKIHTRNNIGPSGKIYFATKQGYPAKGELTIKYPGGYPMAYDPASRTTEVFPIPVPHEGIISIAPDESRGLFYVSTCSDTRPIDHTHFLVYDMNTRRYTHLIDAEHMYAFIVVDFRGRAYHPLRGGDIARYDPETKTLERLRQTIDGQPPAADSHLADEFGHPINWDIAPDGRTLYGVPMSGNALYAYDLTAEGDTLPGRTIGVPLPGETSFDCRGMCVGPTGTVWVAATRRADVELSDGKSRRIAELHLVRYRPGVDAQPVDLGKPFVANPDFTTFTDESGKPPRAHAGFVTLADGKMVNQHVNMGVCEGRDGSVYLLELSPYTVLKIAGDALK